ncbi:MAG: 2-oxoglutarate dehydrogenase complex dihydrolipoyllysine-residue succinyltransferase, partial [Chloroflexota bacterium]
PPSQTPEKEAAASGTPAPPASPVSAPHPTPVPGETVASGESARSTPLARRIAGEHGVDVNQIPGSGPGGRVTRGDVTSYLREGPQTEVAQPAPGTTSVAADAPSEAARIPAGTAPDDMAGRSEERVRMSRRRLTIARRLVEAQQTAAMLTTFNEVDMSMIMDVRARLREGFKQRHGIGLGFMSFFTKAVVSALKEYPRLNAEVQGDDMILKHYYDIGIAVGADEGLVVPVVRNADSLTFAEIEREIADLAQRARSGQLTLAELQGGTFTLSNGGIYGSLLSTPILNAPQVGILGMHKIEQRPVAVDGQVVIKPMMYLALSYDHRIVDGTEAVQFLVRIKEFVEDPGQLLVAS